MMAQHAFATGSIMCPTCGAPVDVFDEIVLHGYSERLSRTYRYHPESTPRLRLNTIKLFLTIIALDVRHYMDDGLTFEQAYRKAVAHVLDVLQSQLSQAAADVDLTVVLKAFTQG